MRRVALTKVVLTCALLTMLGGCELMRPNPGRLFATEYAGYAGRFKLAYARWPKDVNELEEFMCMRGRADKFGLALRHCNDVVNAPYRVRLQPRGVNLQMQFLDANKRRICKLTVRAPSKTDMRAAFPMIVIETTIFSCRGADERWPRANL